MKVIICQISNDPANTMLRVYECIGVCQTEGNVICDIWEEDFFDVLQIENPNPDKLIYNIPKNELLNRSKRNY